MKVWIVWTFSSGKTTLAKQFPKHLIDVEREVLSSYPPLQSMTQKQLDKFQKDILLEQAHKEMTGQYDITDNPLYTSLAYIRMWCSNAMIERATTFIEQYAKYNKIYLATALDIENDWVRHTDKEFQMKIQNEIINVLKDFDKEFVVLPISLEERVKLISSFYFL